jgi:S-formylglutathione hydrolase FrmB
MTQFTLLLALVLLSSVLRAATADTPASMPTKVTKITPDSPSVNAGIRSYTVDCAYQKGPNELEVLLPDDYSPQKRYPVIYMLPVNVGTTGPWGSSVVEAQKNSLQNRFGAIFVAPAYDTVPWFGDNPLRPEIRQNSYITDVVVPFVDKEFSTQAEKGRYLIGFSKSGLGAWSLFLMHLDQFTGVAIFDSYQGQPTQQQWNTWGFADTYGTRENFDLYDPLILLEKQRAALQKDPCRITILGGGPGARVGVDLYRAKLADMKIPYVYIQGADMPHTWTSGWLPMAAAAMLFPPTPKPSVMRPPVSH